jgi:hypothetical protein
VFIRGNHFIGFSLILFGLRDRKLHSYLCFFRLEKEETIIFFYCKNSVRLTHTFFFFFLSPLKGQTGRIFLE